MSDICRLYSESKFRGGRGDGENFQLEMSQKDESNPNDSEINPQGSSMVDDPPTVLPLEVIDRSIGSKIRILLTNNKEFTGTLIGFDDFVNVVLENVVELDSDGKAGAPIKKMLLNGAQIAMLCPTV